MGCDPSCGCDAYYEERIAKANARAALAEKEVDEVVQCPCCGEAYGRDGLIVPPMETAGTTFDALRARVAELEADIKTLFRLRQVKYVRDHACGQCLPEGGDLVREGFVCAFHRCTALVEKEAKP